MDAVFLLNMGGARSPEELKEFLYNMFKDKYIINSPIRHILAPIIANIRYKKVWQSYEMIGGSPIYKHTDSLVKKLSAELDMPVFGVMRYTSPRPREIVKAHKLQRVFLFPLYPHYSITTTKSSLEDALGVLDTQQVSQIEYFYDRPEFNAIIVDKILRSTTQPNKTNLIFSAHGLPKKIIEEGDVYQEHIQKHVEILKNMFKQQGVRFKSINIAYQSRVGPMEWLSPSLEDTLTSFKNQKVLVYPISFIIDNSETDLELGIEYAKLAKQLNIDYQVVKVINDDDRFVKFVANIVKNNFPLSK